jgi:hypothetical protein
MIFFALIKNKFFIFLIITPAIFLLFLFLFTSNILAQEDYRIAKFYNLSDYSFTNQINLPNLGTGYSLSSIDLGGDGNDEILLGSGLKSEPWVYILRQDGSIINKFLAYNKNFIGGVEVMSCDFEGDGKQEILTGVRSNGGAHIRIFDSYGNPKFNPGFFAFKNNQNSGVQILCSDLDGSNKDEIIALVKEENKTLIKIFNTQGELINSRPVDLVGRNPKLSKVDLGGDGKEEIIVSAGHGDKPFIKIFRGDLSLVNEFLFNQENFLGGVKTFGFDMDQDGKEEILALPQISGRPQLKIFNSYGQEKIIQNKIIFEENFLGGLEFTIIKSRDGNKLLALPRNLPVGNQDIYKYINIDVSDQIFDYYQNGFLVNSFITSTGKPSTATRYGDFTAFSKYEMAYGGADGQKWAMPYFISFYTSGNLENGIHELPFLNGIREGSRSLGKAVSHGCVRLGIGPAEEVFNWVEVDKTRVIVVK